MDQQLTYLFSILMKNIKRLLRLLGFILLLVLASFGLGLHGSMFGVFDRRKMNETRVETIDKKNDDETEDSDQAAKR
jgi:hypothetical protein